MDAEDLPGELTLRPSLLKWIGVFLIGAGFTACGVWLRGKEGGSLSLICILFFGLVAVAALIQLFGSSRLHLFAEGFEQDMMGRKLVCRWEEVSEFQVWSTQGHSLVGFDRIQDQNKTIAKVNRFISGSSFSLGDTFGMSAVELADLMNAFRDRAIAQLASDFEQPQF